MSRRIAFLGFLFLLGLTAWAQMRNLEGKVTDESRQALAGVMVRVYAGNRLLGFTTSGRNGQYRLRFASAGQDTLTVAFSKLNYEAFRRRLSPADRRLDATLRRGERRLREVVVKAPPVRTQGDTVLYQLKSFLQSGDHTLEDGLKRIPGIQVDESGKVSYMGRDISQFYIEGMNLLGGRYSLATKNIPSDKVTGVEVLRHHQANKVDRRDLTDNVALNIRLSPKTKLKPFGTYEARLGHRSDGVLYGAGGTGMLFRKDFQMLATLKLSNDGRMGRNELNVHFKGADWSSEAERALPLLAGSQPSMSETRYQTSRNEMASLNALRKLKNGNEWRLNVNYSHRRSGHDYAVLTKYPDTQGQDITVSEQADFRQMEHLADLDLKFRSDRDTRLIENSLTTHGRFAEANAAVLNADVAHQERQQMDAFGLRNALSMVYRRERWKLNFGSTVQYVGMPDNALDFLQDSVGASRQRAYGHHFYTEETFYTGYQLLPALTLALPVKLMAKANRLQTRWQGDTLAVNALQGWDGTLSASPQLEYQTAGRRFRATLAVPLTLIAQHYRNTARDLAVQAQKFCADWWLEMIYVPSGQVEWRATSRQQHGFGDIADLLTAPIQTDYRTISARSGVLGQYRIMSADLSYSWQEPLSFWHFTAQAGYNRRFSSVVRGQQVSSDDVALLEVARPHTADAVTAEASLSKYILSLKTRLSVDGAYGWQQNRSWSQDRFVTTYGSHYTVGGRFSTNPIEPLQAEWRLAYHQNRLRGNGTDSRFGSWSQQWRVAYTLWSAWRMEVSGEWQRNSLPGGGDSQSFSFLDAALEYKFRKPKLRLRLELNNLLNVRSYRYTVYSQLNTYVYRYGLNGREFLLTVTL